LPENQVRSRSAISSYVLGRHHKEHQPIHIKAGKYFEIDNRRGGPYVCIPLIGAGHYGPFGWIWDWWSEIKRVEKGWEERREQMLAELH
jgi:hypothetical protein